MTISIEMTTPVNLREAVIGQYNVVTRTADTYWRKCLHSLTLSAIMMLNIETNTLDADILAQFVVWQAAFCHRKVNSALELLE